MAEGLSLEHLVGQVSRHKVAFFVGRTDTGKSTLIMRIAGQIDASILDADIGQSDIGPPATVSLGEKTDGEYRAVDGYFCGSTSPARHFLQLIAGVSRMMQRARTRPVLINTTGLVVGDAGRSLKLEKINAVRPDLIVAIERGRELKYLDALGHAGAEILHVQPMPGVRTKSIAERAQARMASFRAHFSGARTREHALEGICVERSLLNNGTLAENKGLSAAAGVEIAHAEVAGSEALVVYGRQIAGLDKVAARLGVETIYAWRTSDFSGALVGLVGSRGDLLGLGILESVDFGQGTIRIRSTVEMFSVLQFGSIKLNGGDFSYAGACRPQVWRP